MSSGCSSPVTNQILASQGNLAALRGAYQGTLQNRRRGRTERRRCRLQKWRAGDAHANPAQALPKVTVLGNLNDTGRFLLRSD